MSRLRKEAREADPTTLGSVPKVRQAMLGLHPQFELYLKVGWFRASFLQARFKTNSRRWTRGLPECGKEYATESHFPGKA